MKYDPKVNLSLLCNTYRPPCTDIDYWTRLTYAIELALQVNENIIITGDLNSNLLCSNNNKLIDLVNIFNLKNVIDKPTRISIRYNTIETKEAARIGYNGFLFSHEYSGEGRGGGKNATSNTGKFFCFNSTVSKLYNNSVVEKINGMAYIFTLLMFRKPNKTTINKFVSVNVLSILVYI